MNIRGPFTKIAFENINLDSSDQVKKYLLSVGWIPTEYNFSKTTGERTSPKLTEDSFSSIKDDTGKLVSERSVLVHRRRLLQNIEDPENKGLISLIREDGRITAGAIICATPTARASHIGIVNIPRVSTALGKEIRELFYCLPPYVQLGLDLASIETRVLAHFTTSYDGGEYWNYINEVPDIHRATADILGCDRNTAKTFRYA